MTHTGLTDRLKRAADRREVQISVTSAGNEALLAVGQDWLASVVAAASVAHPHSPIELVLVPADREPVEPAWSVTPGLPGDWFTQHGALGLVTIEGDDAHEPIGRIVRVPTPDLLAGETQFAFVDGRHGIRRRIGQVYGELYRRAPLLLDQYKQVRTARRPWLTKTHARGAQPLAALDAPTPPRPQGKIGAWFALHWLEAGGAESWAFESAQLAADSGLEVVVTVDRAAPQRQLARALAITPHVYLAANVLTWPDWSEFGPNVIRHHNVGVIHIHHSSAAYQLLPLIRHTFPTVRVFDSTHLPEHRTGGFVRQSMEHSNLIDLHHVISPVLRDNYILDAQIPAERVAYRPLTGLAGQVAATPPTVWAGATPLTVGFLGRLAPQKRPFLFVELVKRLHKAAPGRFRFVMQGSGPLEQIVTENIARAGMTSVIERRDWGPAEDFLSDVDVLVVSSDNEGLTLTALEAAQHGVLVLSADVGSQVTVTAPDLVMPATPLGFLKAAQAALTCLSRDPARFAAELHQQEALNDDLRRQESATAYFTEVFDHLAKEHA